MSLTVLRLVQASGTMRRGCRQGGGTRPWGWLGRTRCCSSLHAAHTAPTASGACLRTTCARPSPPLAPSANKGAIALPRRFHITRRHAAHAPGVGCGAGCRSSLRIARYCRRRYGCSMALRAWTAPSRKWKVLEWPHSTLCVLPRAAITARIKSALPAAPSCLCSCGHRCGAVRVRDERQQRRGGEHCSGGRRCSGARGR